MVLHEFPARLTDLVVRTFGKQPFALRFPIKTKNCFRLANFSAIFRLCNKMQRGMRSLEYFTTHQVGEKHFSFLAKIFSNVQTFAWDDKFDGL